MTLSLVVIAAQIALSLFLLLWTRAKVKAALNSGAEVERIRREISALLIELDASADRNVTVIEDRIAELKDAIAEADKRLAAMAREGSKRNVESAVYDRLGRVRREGPIGGSDMSLGPAPAARTEPSPAKRVEPIPAIRTEPTMPSAAVGSAAVPSAGSADASLRTADSSAGSGEARPPTPTAAPQSAPPAAPASGPAPGDAVPFVRFSDRPVDIEEPFADRAAAMARKGFSSDIIAARLGATITEVDIALAAVEARRGPVGGS